MKRPRRGLRRPTVYVAARLDRAPIAQEAMRLLRARGWRVLHDWTRYAPGGDLEGMRPPTLSTRALRAVREADLVVVLLPGGRGTHVELGAALALGKPVIVQARTPADLAEGTGTFPFYCHPRVRTVSDLEELRVLAARSGGT